MKHILIALLVSNLYLICHADEFPKAFGRAWLSAKALEQLKSKDVPPEWRLSCTTNMTRERITVTYARGTNTVMKLIRHDNTNGLIASALLDGTNYVAYLMISNDSVSFSQVITPDKYDIMVHVNQATNSAITVNGPNGFFEWYILDGRNTAPMDDLPFTKCRLYTDSVWKPFAATVTNSARGTR